MSSQISKPLPSTINHTTGHLDPTPSPMQNESYEDAERLKKLVKDDVAQASVEKVHGEKEEITSSQDSTIAMQDRDGEATKAMKQKGTILNEEKKQSAAEEKAAAELWLAGRGSSESEAGSREREGVEGVAAHQDDGIWPREACRLPLAIHHRVAP